MFFGNVPLLKNKPPFFKPPPSDYGNGCAFDYLSSHTCRIVHKCRRGEPVSCCCLGSSPFHICVITIVLGRMKTHCELPYADVPGIRGRLPVCSHGAQIPSVFERPFRVPASTTLLAVCAALGPPPRTQYSLFPGLLVGSAATGLWVARKETCTIAMNDVLDTLQLPLSCRTQNMMWSQGLRTLCDHIMAATIVDTHVIHVVQYGSTCVALGCSLHRIAFVRSFYEHTKPPPLFPRAQFSGAFL